MNTILLSVIQTVLILVLAPFMIGVVRKMKARFQNRRGASMFTPYFQILSLFRKEMTITKQASWVFRVVPFVVLGCAIALALLVPTFGVGGWVSFGRNSIFLLAAILALGSIFLVFGGMDTASAFGGMGSSREMTLAALVEPAVVLVLVTFGYATHQWQLDGIMQAFTLLPWYAWPGLTLTLAALVMVILAENARYPVDNPATHLELTMVHEAMILEYSGPYLAMLEYASAIKLAVLSVFLLDIIWPVGLVLPSMGVTDVFLGIAAVIVKVMLAGCLVALVESTIVKMRFYRMQEYMMTASVLALGGFVITSLFSR